MDEARHRIKALIATTREWRSFHDERRRLAEIGSRKRSEDGIEALACAIREKALREALACLRDPT